MKLKSLFFSGFLLFFSINGVAVVIDAKQNDVIPVVSHLNGHAPKIRKGTIAKIEDKSIQDPMPLSPSPASAQKGQSRLWNLQDADILSVINEVSLETGKNFVVDPRVTGKISLISSKPIKPGEVYQIFLSILEMLGYSAIPNGNLVKIVPNMESGEFATRIADACNPGKGDEVVVRVIPLENVSANQLIPIIRPLLPQWSNVSTYMPGNVIILLGRAANLQRIANIIHDVDQASNNEIDVVPLHQASAAQVAAVLNNLQNAARAQGENPQVSIAANERNNSVLLSGNHSARLRMRFLISQLDIPTSGEQGNTEVIYLRYLQAKDFAPLLGRIAQNILGKPSNDSPAVSVSNIAVASAPPSGVSPLTASSTEVKETAPDNHTIIQAEPNTNALIITAPPTLMRALKIVVAKLDIRPAQVLVEAIIAEIDEGKLRNLGIQWGTRVPFTTRDFISGTTNANNNTTPDGFPPYGVNVFGIIPSTQIKAVLTLLEETTGADILSTPSIVVLDNQKATLEIGQQVPTQTGSYATTGNATTATPYNTVDYKSVTLKLDVTPQINLGNAVRLKIALKNDSLENPNTPTLTPTFNTSKIDNSVIINSDDILVLGGLISNNITENINKIPILGDIPLIGNAFRQTTRQLSKKKLMVFIKPIILRNCEESTVITHIKYTNIRDTQVNWPAQLTTGGVKEAAIMPLFKREVVLPKPFECQGNGC